jgi:hypothetical protein
MPRLSPPAAAVAGIPLSGPLEVLDDAPLDERIAKVFANGVSSAGVRRLLQQVEEAAVAAQQRAEQAKKKALDPQVTASALRLARTEMEDCSFQHQRLQAAIGRLRQRLAEVTENENDAKRLVEYQKVQGERDRLAAELRELYPEFADKLAALLTKIAANDRLVAYVNLPSERPRGRPALQTAELVARELDSLQRGATNIPSLVADVVLPRFRYSPNALRWLWPPQR